MVGERAAEYPAAVREIAAQGHTIGTHTWSHLNIKRLSDEQAKIQIEAALLATKRPLDSRSLRSSAIPT